MTKLSPINSDLAPRAFIHSMAVSHHSIDKSNSSFFEVAFLSQTSFYNGDNNDGDDMSRPRLEFVAGMDLETLKMVSVRLSEIIKSVEESNAA